MSEQDLINRENYLKIVKKVWSLDDESMKFIEKRTTDEWQPPQEYKDFLKNYKYENQRYRIPVDFDNPEVSSQIERFDESFSMFRYYFNNALEYFTVSYKDFLNNKVVYNKNLTKIKKVLEKIYSENSDCFERDARDTHLFEGSTSLEAINKYITKAYEKIGEKKKPANTNLTLVISFNPCDWFLASTSESFSSCFNLNSVKGSYEGGYKYSLGLPFLNGDPNRCFVYLTRGEMKEWEGIKVESVLSRSWAFLEKRGYVSICKWYPNMIFNSDTLNSIIKEKMFKEPECFNEGKYPIKPLSTENGLVISVYNDVGHWEFDKEAKVIYHKGHEKSGQQIFTKRGTSQEQESFSQSTYNLDNVPSEIKFVYSRWLKVGLSLGKILPKYKCESCGNEKGGFFRRHSFFCYDCYEDNQKKCKRCGERYWLTEDIKNRKPLIDTKGNEIDFCPSCYKEAQKYVCSECGRYDENSVVVGGKRVCKSCLSKPTSKYIVSSDGDIILKEDAYYVFYPEENKIKIKEGNREVTSDNDFYEDYGFVNMQPVVYTYRDGNEI